MTKLLLKSLMKLAPAFTFHNSVDHDVEQALISDLGAQQ